MTVIELLRQKSARRVALYVYAQSHDLFSELEQVYVATDETDRAAGAHECALIALRAYRAEMDDPEVPAHDCPECHDDRAREGWR